jgi:endogenous inhibitor of DNA gyrase (YacG/DUF329 family)
MRDRDKRKAQPHRRGQYTCPICKRHLTASGSDPAKLPAFFPFCSQRCKLIDLGAWLDADYRIAGKPEESSEHPPGGSSPLEPEDAQKQGR